MARHSVLCFALCAMLIALCVPTEAQQPKKIPRIGFASSNSVADMSTRTEAFRLGLHEFGYVEGKNIVTEYRYAEGKLDRLSELIDDLVRLKMDIIVSGGPVATRRAKNATSTIPIVMAFDEDPVRNGFIISLAHPGGNITGLSALAPEMSAKQLELLKEIIPNLIRVAVLWNSSQPGNAQSLREVELAAGSYRLKLQTLDIRDSTDIETAFREATRGRAEAVLAFGSPVLFSQRKQLAEMALKSRLPAIYGQSDYMEVGGLMFYGASITDLYRRAAPYVDKILKGAKPSDLPVEQPKKFELVINLKTAKQIGLTIPPNVLARADRVIK